MFRVHYCQDFEGDIWKSTEIFSCPTMQHVRQGVIGGHIAGKRRWAISADDGTFLYGLDGKGKEMSGAPKRLRCDMISTCATRVTHIDRKGFVYCEAHGRERRATMPCRQMTAAEIVQLTEGVPIPYSRSS